MISPSIANINQSSFQNPSTSLPASSPITVSSEPVSAANYVPGTPIPIEPVTVFSIAGRPIPSNSLTTIDLGDGTVLTFDPKSTYAIAKPALDPANTLYDNPGESTFTASDCRVLVEIPQTPVFNGSKIQSRVAKQLIEITTLSVSIHRSKVPVRSFGYINPKGFARGSRTIAGTMVLTKTTAEVLYTFLQSGLMADLSKDTTYTKLDQLPPIDFTLLFSNEAGYISSQRLLGVELVTDGTVVSIQDILLEQQITWVAADLTPLTPLNFNSFFGVTTTPSNMLQTNKTFSSVMNQQQSNVLSSAFNDTTIKSPMNDSGTDYLGLLNL